ncbi:MAG: homoserine dehydrogenase [Clostridiales bacterium]|nr:homoserine dehydrogenase [Clostridiales bacterium]MDD7387260.1 homoserine dehydrogenase [Bacillota bacterium]MDY6040794.1 homoserine dehydrogenase [Candidatus Faecousia sp.]
MKIGLLGFGTVGKGVYDLTKPRADMQVVRVLCRRELHLPDAEVTHNFEDILRDDSIDTVVEAIGGLHPAWDYVKSAIEAGKNVVTANKAMVATFYDELIPLTEKMGVHFRCTASVGGGIGWLSELERVRRIETVSRVGGIMNGTCNYILDSMSRLNLDYAEALRQAQELGYAEADPSTDVDGIDTWHKLIVSANIAFGVSLDRNAIPAAGIRSISAADVEEFKKRDLVCKLVSTATSQDGRFSAYVQPTLYPQGQPEAAVPANYNLITLEGNVSGRQSFFGQGAGRYPTAYNVVQDCADFLTGHGFYGPGGPKVSIDNSEKMVYYVRGEKDAWLVANGAESWGSAIVTKPVSVEDMHAWLRAHPGSFIAAVPSYL